MKKKTASRAHRSGSGSGEGIIRTIAVFKFLKATLLIVVGLGAFELLNPAAAHTADRWVSTLAWRLGPRAASALEQKLSNLHPEQFKVAGIAALLYAALFLVEGIGLWKEKRWAEYLTIIATSSFVPVEVYELAKRFTWQRCAALVINLLVVGYLIWKVRQHPGRAAAGHKR